MRRKKRLRSAARPPMRWIDIWLKVIDIIQSVQIVASYITDALSWLGKFLGM